MKPRLSKKSNRALTFIEVLVIVAVLAILAAVLLPILAGARGTPQRINCLSNLKQINLSFRIWEGDNNNEYPMQLSVTNDGAREWIATNNVAACFQLMSNELSTPKILVCPEDSVRTAATNFGDDFDNSHISYFVGVDADEAHTNRLLSGDDNFQMNGAIVPSGVLQYVKRTPIGWSSGRHDAPSRIPFLGIPLHHHYYGNIGFADGSVAQVSSVGLQESLSLSGLATNRLAIP